VIKAILEGAELLNVADRAERWEDQRKSYSINHKWLSEEQKQLLMMANHPASPRRRKQAFCFGQIRHGRGRVAQQWPLGGVRSLTPHTALLMGTLTGEVQRTVFFVVSC